MGRRTYATRFLKNKWWKRESADKKPPRLWATRRAAKKQKDSSSELRKALGVSVRRTRGALWSLQVHAAVSINN